MDPNGVPGREESEGMFLSPDPPTADNAVVPNGEGADDNNNPREGSAESPVEIEDDQDEGEEGAMDVDDPELAGSDGENENPEDDDAEDLPQNEHAPEVAGSSSGPPKPQRGPCGNPGCDKSIKWHEQRCIDLENQIRDLIATHRNDLDEEVAAHGETRDKFKEFKERAKAKEKELLDKNRDIKKKAETKAQDKEAEFNRKIRRFEDKIEKLKARLEHARGEKNHRTQRTWPKLLRMAQRGLFPYKEVCRLSNLEENMSPLKPKKHPDIEFVPPKHLQPEPEPYNHGGSPPRGFCFDELPADCQSLIFAQIYYKVDLVHCISRLDPYVLPGANEVNPRGKCTGLLNRFHWGPRECSIDQAFRGNDVLKLFLVSKRWYYIGAHAFYGLNTFAFSSLGELGRFCTGIGRCRTARLQNVELTWLGSQYLVFPRVKDEHGKVRYESRRTKPLRHFTRMPRIKTAVVHIDESSKAVQRRAHEPQDLIDYMAKVTGTQPNERSHRALRTVQGMDYLHCLRGMKWIRIYDLCLDMEFVDQEGIADRKPVRDISFTKELNKTATMEKLPAYQVPSELDKEIVDTFNDKTSKEQAISNDMDNPIMIHDSDSDDDAPPSPPSGRRTSPHGPSPPNRGPAADPDSGDDADADSVISVGSSSLPGDYSDGVYSIPPSRGVSEIAEEEAPEAPDGVDEEMFLAADEEPDAQQPPLVQTGEIIEILDDSDSEEDEDIPSGSAPDRRSTSENMFVTPNPGENVRRESTESSSGNSVVDLTAGADPAGAYMPQGQKRSRSVDDDPEARKRQHRGMDFRRFFPSPSTS